MKYLIFLFLALGANFHDWGADLSTDNGGDTTIQIEEIHINDPASAFLQPKAGMKVLDPQIEKNIPILIDGTQDHGNVSMPNSYKTNHLIIKL